MQKKKATTKTEEVVEEVETKPSSNELIEEIDDFLDEIDTILEETTVSTEYRQRGGQ